jgi:hypothetical protein
MPETINWAATFDTTLGPKIAISGKEIVAAYDKISVQLPGKANTIDVKLQPSNVAGDVRLLVVTSTSYAVKATLSADAGTTSRELDGPLVLIGSGAVGLLSTTAPQTLRFTNPDKDPIEIQILVGRKV